MKYFYLVFHLRMELIEIEKDCHSMRTINIFLKYKKQIEPFEENTAEEVILVSMQLTSFGETTENRLRVGVGLCGRWEEKLGLSRGIH